MLVLVALLSLKLVELFRVFAESVVLPLVLWWCLDFAANESDVISVDAVIATAKIITIASTFVTFVFIEAQQDYIQYIESVKIAYNIIKRYFIRKQLCLHSNNLVDWSWGQKS